MLRINRRVTLGRAPIAACRLRTLIVVLLTGCSDAPVRDVWAQSGRSAPFAALRGIVLPMTLAQLKQSRPNVRFDRGLGYFEEEAGWHIGYGVPDRAEESPAADDATITAVSLSRRVVDEHAAHSTWTALVQRAAPSAPRALTCVTVRSTTTTGHEAQWSSNGDDVVIAAYHVISPPAHDSSLLLLTVARRGWVDRLWEGAPHGEAGIQRRPATCPRGGTGLHPLGAGEPIHALTHR